MSQLDLSGCKKRKRGERVFKFKTFGENGYPVDWNGTFWQNVKSLLGFGHFESEYVCCGMASWSFQLEVHRHPPVHVMLFVVEEPVEVSINRNCKYCHYIGWGHHMICNKKYHFLVPSKDTIVACLNCGGNSTRAITKGKSNLVELQGHAMHGVFHSNGFGHLLCVNGLETGSDLPGYQIMDFWDRLCNGLGARKVSLYDTSQKKDIELRLIHGIVYGKPWFGRWGYKFGRGSYNVTQPMYQRAIEAIRNIPMCLFVTDLGPSNHEIPIILSRYQTLSGRSLVTLADLLHFMLELKYRLPKETRAESYNLGVLVESNCRWSPKRVEMATRVIVESLKRADYRWVSRQEVRDAARTYIGDTGLLDFVLKSLGNHIVGNYLVRRSLNPVTKVLEYCLEDISNAYVLGQEGGLVTATDQRTKLARNAITRLQLIKDASYLYRHIVKEKNPTVAVASRIILDSKYLVKEFSEVRIGSDPSVNCTIVLRNDSFADDRFKDVALPYESFAVNPNATFHDLKLQVEKRFREIYWGMSHFMVEMAINGSDSIIGSIGSGGGEVVFEGKVGEISAINENMLFEGARNKGFVDCSCGTKDDDGERMVSCDICEVWQHTRCVRIPNNEQIPTIFLCNRCEQDIVLFPCLP